MTVGLSWGFTEAPKDHSWKAEKEKEPCWSEPSPDSSKVRKVTAFGASILFYCLKVDHLDASHMSVSDEKNGDAMSWVQKFL